MNPAAYQGCNFWRAAAFEGEECKLMTAHMFDSEDEALSFANLFISATNEQRILLKKFGAGAGYSDPPLPTLIVKLLESYTKKEA